METVTSGIPFRFASWYILQVQGPKVRNWMLNDRGANTRVVVLVPVVIPVTQPVPSPSYPSRRELSPPWMEVDVEFADIRTRKVYITVKLVVHVHLLDVIEVVSHVRRFGLI